MILSVSLVPSNCFISLTMLPPSSLFYLSATRGGFPLVAIKGSFTETQPQVCVKNSTAMRVLCRVEKSPPWVKYFKVALKTFWLGSFDSVLIGDVVGSRICCTAVSMSLLSTSYYLIQSQCHRSSMFLLLPLLLLLHCRLRLIS